MTLLREDVGPEGIAPLPERDGRGGERGVRWIGGGDEVHAGRPCPLGRRERVRRQARLRVVPDHDDLRIGVDARIEIALPEGVHAGVIGEGLPVRVAAENEVARHVELTVAAEHATREIQHGREGRDWKRVDGPESRRIPGLADRDAEARGKEQLVERDHRQHEPVAGGVVVGGGIRDESEEVVGGCVTVRMVSEERVEVGRGHRDRRPGERARHVVRLDPDAHGVVYRLDDVGGADGDGPIRGIDVERPRGLIDPVQPQERRGRRTRGAGT